MRDELILSNKQEIENRILTIRGVQVLLDTHLAEMYNVDTKRLNEQVRRNSDRFPESFRFQLTNSELENLKSHFANSSSVSLRSQIATLNEDPLMFISGSLNKGRGQHRKYLPYGFTEQGVAMLSAVLHSETAVKVSIRIMEAFVEMRKMVTENAVLFQRLDRIELKQLETDHKFEQVFKALESHNKLPDKGIFFDGQIFDAWQFVSDLVRKAIKSILLIDNYIDDTVLGLFIKREKGVAVTIYTKNTGKQLAVDVAKHNAQYEPIAVKEFAAAHDRFLLIDETELYHIGASLKDLGKKWFAFSKMDSQTLEIINLLNIKTNE